MIASAQLAPVVRFGGAVDGLGFAGARTGDPAL
jgi:hypothetical protein